MLTGSWWEVQVGIKPRHCGMGRGVPSDILPATPNSCLCPLCSTLICPATSYTDKLWVWSSFWITLNTAFFFPTTQRVNEHIGLYKAKTGVSKNSSAEISFLMKPMGSFLTTSLPSSVRWVPLPHYGRSHSRVPWPHGTALAVCSENSTQVGGATQMLVVWLTELPHILKRSKLLTISAFYSHYCFELKRLHAVLGYFSLAPLRFFTWCLEGLSL